MELGGGDREQRGGRPLPHLRAACAPNLTHGRGLLLTGQPSETPATFHKRGTQGQDRRGTQGTREAGKAGGGAQVYGCRCTVSPAALISRWDRIPASAQKARLKKESFLKSPARAVEGCVGSTPGPGSGEKGLGRAPGGGGGATDKGPERQRRSTAPCSPGRGPGYLTGSIHWVTWCCSRAASVAPSTLRRGIWNSRAVNRAGKKACTSVLRLGSSSSSWRALVACSGRKAGPSSPTSPTLGP